MRYKHIGTEPRSAHRHTRLIIHPALLIALCLLLIGQPTRAQSDCGTVDLVIPPVPHETFMLAQDFGVASVRHRGAYHTGEDWYGGPGVTYGHPVRAAAAGRVVYSYRLGWGRDGGVVIIEHILPDDSIVYTQYGHIMPTDTAPLPEGLSCVRAGQVIGAIGESRPAPHLHFEVRINNPNTPGPGYTAAYPTEEGYRDPTQFLRNAQAWLHPAYDWHLALNADAITGQPLRLNDDSLLYLDDDTLRRATDDGRVLWRIRLDAPAVAITGYQGTPLLIYADGTFQAVDPEGFLGESWRVPDVTFSGPMLPVRDWLLFHTTRNEIVAVNETRRGIVWRVPDVPSFVRGHVAGTDLNFTIGLLTATNEMLKISGSGVVIERAQLREPGAFATARDGRTLLAYTRGGLWQVDIDGDWALALDDAPAGGASSAVQVLEDGRLLLFDGETLHAYDADNQVLWQAGVLDVTGRVQLAQIGPVTLLVSSGGTLAAINRSGIVCGQTRLAGGADRLPWHALGDDGRLRLALADQIVAFDWDDFTEACG